MKRFAISVVTAMVVTGYGSAAFAGPQCTDEPKENWLSETEMKAKIADTKTTIDVFKTTKGNCYEIYGKNEKGERVEIYFHPLTGAVVKVVKV